jgi:hypothetical protein
VWCLVQVRMSKGRRIAYKSDNTQGPAHAVYFATYEVVKQAMGGNAAGHHPVAAGTFFFWEARRLVIANTRQQQQAVHAPLSLAMLS